MWVWEWKWLIELCVKCNDNSSLAYDASVTKSFCEIGYKQIKMSLIKRRFVFPLLTEKEYKTGVFL